MRRVWPPSRTRITSACAERTPASSRKARSSSDHLRLRGENDRGRVAVRRDGGSPPPARRELTGSDAPAFATRITSACAERTSRLNSASSPVADHLRLRGENTRMGKALATTIGSPPPARRERVLRAPTRQADRITSACAERTCGRTLQHPVRADHLRLRGENLRPSSPFALTSGSPPPARRERADARRPGPGMRITSACAERTKATKDGLMKQYGSPPPARREPGPTCPPGSNGADHPRLRGENQVAGVAGPSAGGSPPPARREPRRPRRGRRRLRITSACAERTWRARVAAVNDTDHLRLRGENTEYGFAMTGRPGSPPPARRERRRRLRRTETVRITSACAERTRPHTAASRYPSDHLRLRGENASSASASGQDSGSPPPARRELALVAVVLDTHRITSACAERTDRSWRTSSANSDHLRLRGENVPVRRVGAVGRGSPPPARRERAGGFSVLFRPRITSACAERTRRPPGLVRPPADHLRLRGENVPGRSGPVRVVGSPPPARREPKNPQIADPVYWITSACAERTWRPESGGRWPTDHLRLRGENITRMGRPLRSCGSPPPARRELLPQRRQPLDPRITSACAERTTGRTGRSGRRPDHLRLRGENTPRPVSRWREDGSPPPARRERGRGGGGIPERRITSACAERTDVHLVEAGALPDHLRLRGENASTSSTLIA